MQEKFLKARVPRPLYDALQKRAAEAGQRLGTLVREVLERDAQVMSAAEALARIEAALASSQAIAAPALPSMPDHALHRDMLELRLIVRELAMHMNAQILARVAAQIAANASTNQASRSN
jgi:hypothetical protein